MPTYNRHYSYAYSLIRDVRDVNDFNSITRQQLGRNNFSRDQAIAADQAGFDRATMLREAARDNSRLRNLHPQMGNINTTGGFGGGGYATGRNGVATQDYGLPSDGNGIACLIELGKLAGSVDDFILISQAICKPNTAVYGRYIEKQGNGIFLTTTKTTTPQGATIYTTRQSHGPEDKNTYTDGRGQTIQRYPTTRLIQNINHVSHDASTTEIQVSSSIQRSTYLTLDVSINPDITYWFVRVYNKLTTEEILIHVPQADCIQRYFGKEAVTNNYPNVPLGRVMDFDQAYFDQYKGDIEEYPLTEEREAYDEEHEEELEDLNESLDDLQLELDAALDGQDEALSDLAELSDDEQDYLTSKYFNTIVPILNELGLDPNTYTQAQLDAIGDTALTAWHNDLVGFSPDVTPLWESQRVGLGYTLTWLDLLNGTAAAINDFVAQEVPAGVDIYWDVTDADGVVHKSQLVYGPVTEPNFASMTYTEAVNLGIVEPTVGLVEVSSVLVFDSEAAAYYLVELLDPAPTNMATISERYDAYTFKLERVVVIEDTHEDLVELVPSKDPITVMHIFATALPWMYEEERVVEAMSVINQRKMEIYTGAPQSEFTSNQFYSEWGEWTFFKDYRTEFNDMYETFMSEGFPQHEEVKRFISMIGQKPRTISDMVRATAQDEKPEGGGEAKTLTDQLTLGCQITANADYAEMRYFVEFARSAWWYTPFSEVDTITAQENEIVTNGLGQSAWGISSVEENMVNPMVSTFGPTRTRWGTVEVWIEDGEEDYGQFGHIVLSQALEEETSTTSRHESNSWTGYSSNEQEVIASYNIAEGLVLKVRMTRLSTIFYTKLEGAGGKWAGGNSLDYPILPLFYNVIAGIPQQQICQISGDFIFVRSHTYWKQYRSSWVNFRDKVLYKIVGIVLMVVGFILALPSGGASLTLAGLGTTLMYAAIYYAAMRVIAHFIKQWGWDKTWIGAIILVVIAIVGIMYGMPPQDAILLSTTMTADAMATAYEQINLAEAKEHAGKMLELEDLIDTVTDDLAQMEEDQYWLDFYSASDLVKMRQEAVDYVRDETPDQYFRRMMEYNENMLNLDAVDYFYDANLDLTFK
ncbi:hypothetical protein OAP32_00660 [Crocinitomicaceae bacterium]|nr:hypothetical protein [Crocinitomicaceae bacterium]